MMTADAGNLVKLFEQLNPVLRRRAIKGGVLRMAAKVRRRAIENMRTAKGGHHGVFRPSKEVEKQLMRFVYKKGLGFRLTVGPQKRSKTRPTVIIKTDKYGRVTLKRKGDLPPILMWAEGGTKRRNTKTQTKVYRRMRNGHYTGEMPRFGFMEKTRKEMDPVVTEEMIGLVNENIRKTAEKYGCKVT